VCFVLCLGFEVVGCFRVWFVWCGGGGVNYRVVVGFGVIWLLEGVG
jgi:hypothetical protein